MSPDAPLPCPLTTLAATIAEKLAAHGLPSPRREARALLALALDLPADAALRWPHRPVSAAEQARAEALLSRRLAGEPLSRLRGVREFWSLPFQLSPATLDPRPDSETLIEAVLKLYPNRQVPLRMLDLGTGSGCLLLSLLSEYPQAWGVGVDLAPLAAQTAAANARQLGLADRAAFVVGNWAEAIAHTSACRFDLVISNPPYIPANDIARLEAGVRDYDPLLALDGGADGLVAYRAIAPRLQDLLTAHGLACLEIGIGQEASVLALLTACGLVVTAVVPDPGGHPRIVIAKHAGPVYERPQSATGE